MENARREAETILSELKKIKKNAAVAQTPDHQVNELRKRIEDNIDSLSEGLRQKVDTVTAPPKSLKIGDEVDILTLNTRGTVLGVPDARGEVQVQAGIMKMKVHISQLRLVKKDKPAQPKKTTVKMNSNALTRSVRMECDVRGQTLEEAINEVDIFLSEGVMSSLNEVFIIHGKGTGVLRSGIQQHLRHHMNVKSFRRGVYGEGEDGVTVVTLK